MNEQEQLEFYRLLEILANDDDMANMTIINKAVGLKQLIDEL